MSTRWAFIALLATASASLAQPIFFEPTTQDAGSTLADAVFTSGRGLVTQIRGELTFDEAVVGVDIYAVVQVAGETLTVKTTNAFTDFDTILFIFDQDGNAIAFNDDSDDPVYQLQSLVTINSLPVNRRVYIAVTGYQLHPRNAGDPDNFIDPEYIFDPTEGTGIREPVVTDTQLFDWAEFQDQPPALGSYRLEIIGARYAITGDLNLDRTVDTDDAILLISELGRPLIGGPIQNPLSDLSGDSAVSAIDLAELLSNLGVTL